MGFNRPGQIVAWSDPKIAHAHSCTSFTSFFGVDITNSLSRLSPRIDSIHALTAETITKVEVLLRLSQPTVAKGTKARRIQTLMPGFQRAVSSLFTC